MIFLSPLYFYCNKKKKLLLLLHFIGMSIAYRKWIGKQKDGSISFMDKATSALGTSGDE